MDSADSVLCLERICKRWPGTSSPVLERASLTVGPGESVAVTGRNGAGKTTLLRIAASLIIPDSGLVRIAGMDPERDRAECQRRIGFLSAGNSGLYARLHVQHHLDFWARLSLLPGRERRAAVEWALSRFELRPLCGKRVARLSMGQRQRLRIALTFLHRPRLVLLDEPRTSLDEEGAELLADAVADFCRTGGAAVVCAPTGEDAGVSFERVVVVDDGLVRTPT